MNNKTTLFLIGALGLASLGHAQITLNASDFPGAGYVSTSQSLDSVSVANLAIGTAGANQSWDFSGVALGEESYTNYYVDAAGTPYAGDFPTATLAISTEEDLNDPASVFTYLRIAGGEVLNLGTGASDGPAVFIDPIKMAQFPFSYNDEFNDIGQLESLNAEGGLDTIEIAINVKADAWGTIKTPSGSFQALRVKQEQSFEYELFGLPISSYIETYAWYSKEHKAPVFSYQVAELVFAGQPQTTVTAEYLVDEETATKNLDLLPMALNPNPAADRSKLSFDLLEGGRFQILVTDLSGKVLRSQAENLSAGAQQVELSVAGLAAGMYQVQVLKGNQLIALERLVKQ